MARTTDITSFTEHRRKLREHIDRVRETGRPMYITTNGQTDAVVLSPEAYDDLAEKAELIESLRVIEQSMEDVRAGRGKPLDEAIRGIADDLGLKLE